MNIMLIDDEPILRQGIKNKINKFKLPVTIVGEAGDGQTALDLLESCNADIVITDIRMPAMNGLQFIERSLRLKPSLSFIIVSGYSEFEYAQQAIQYGVSNYLLKPVQDEEFRDSLARIIERIEKERDSNAEKEQLVQSRELSRATLRQQYLTQLVQLSERDPSTGRGDEDLERLRLSCTHYAAIVLVLEPFKLPHYSFVEGDEELVWFAIENIMSERFRSAGRQGVLFKHIVHQNELVYLIGVDGPSEGPVIRQWLHEVLRGMQRYLRLDVTIGLGTVIDSFEHIQRSYQQAKQALRNATIRGTGTVYDYDTIGKQTADRPPFLTEGDERILIEWLNEGNSASLQRWIEHKLRAAIQSPNATTSQIEWACVELYSLFRKYLMSHTSLTEWIIGEMDDLHSWLQSLSDWDEAISRMQGIVANVVGYLSHKKDMSGARLIEEMKKYIDSNFHREITLQTISEKFYIHPNYFSRRFRETFGESFHEYLTGVRMRTAAKAMEETDLKVLQIAQMVGFEDSAYFSSAFRKFHGTTPKKYREHFHNES